MGWLGWRPLLEHVCAQLSAPAGSGQKPWQTTASSHPSYEGGAVGLAYVRLPPDSRPNPQICAVGPSLRIARAIPWWGSPLIIVRFVAGWRDLPGAPAGMQQQLSTLTQLYINCLISFVDSAHDCDHHVPPHTPPNKIPACMCTPPYSPDSPPTLTTPLGP